MSDTDYAYEAEVETENGTVTFRGNRAQTVAAQAARMPAIHEQNRRQRALNLDYEEWVRQHYPEEGTDD